MKKYGITDAEIERFDVKYDKKRELLCFPAKQEDGRISGYVCRNFGPTRLQRKYLFYGSRRQPPIIASPEAAKNTAVFVEDMLSAIKVGRSYTGLPVMGAEIDAKALKWASDRFKWVGVWLDRDMHGKVSRIAFKGRLLGGSVFPIFTRLDPKEYSTEQIVGFVEEARNIFSETELSFKKDV